jgi:HK97 family phage major capsid protein
VQELELLYAKLNGEQRAITEEEERQIEAISDEIEGIDKTINILESMKQRLIKTNEDKREVIDDVTGEQRAEQEKADEKAFANYIRGIVSEERAENLTFTDNGAVIPTTIANRIIKKVYDISPILERSTKYNVKGTLEIPYYPESDDTDITMAYATEFVELESSAGKFTNISLTGYLAGALTLVSRSLINNSQFDIVGFVVDHMAYNIHRWIENELLNGTVSKIEGLSGVTQEVTAAATTAVTADELIQLQDTVKDAFQANAIWIMSPATRTALRQLKDDVGRYLLQDDITAPFGKVLLGKPVYVSDNMPNMAAGKAAIYYGDMTGLAVKITEEMEIQVLREKYATQHADGVVAWIEMDAKVENAQKIAKLEMAAS